MSTIFIAGVIVGFVLVVCLLLISINGRHRRKAANELVALFRRKEKENELLISKWEVAGKLVIGLEEEGKAILAFHKHQGQYKSDLVELSKVKNCQKKKVYSGDGAGNEGYGRQVEKIYLQFNFIDDRPPVQIVFYSSMDNQLLEMAEMEQKAMDWEQIVKGVLHKDLKIA